MPDQRAAKARRRIAEAARRIISKDGLNAFTLEAVARRVGVTKQAVLYHYGSRTGLLNEVYLAELAAEAKVLADAAANAPPGTPAIAAFLRAALDWHLADLNRVRLIYMTAQMSTQREPMDDATKRERVYPVTTTIYSSLQERIEADGGLPSGQQARQLAIAIHMLALGIACYAGMLDAVDETFVQDWHEVGEALVTALSKGRLGGD